MKGSARGVASSCACSGQFEYQSEASGLILLGHRYYDPTLGRFLTRDPVGDGSNWYAYCANDPLGLADPGGLTALPVMAAVMAFENPPKRIRLVAALPGAHGYVFGHAWVDVVYWDGSAERFESLPFEGNKATCQPIAEDYFSAWTDVYVTERPIRRLKFRPDDGWIGYEPFIENCVYFARLMWLANTDEWGFRTLPPPFHGLLPPVFTPNRLVFDHGMEQ